MPGRPRAPGRGPDYPDPVMRAPRFAAIDASTKIRLAFAVLAAFIAAMTENAVAVLPWLAIVVVIDLVIVALDRMPISRRGLLDTVILALLAVDAAAAGAGYAVAGLGAALLILIPAYHAGTRFGRIGFLLAVVMGGIAYLLVALTSDDQEAFTFGVFAWLAAAMILGGLGVWNQRLVAEQDRRVVGPGGA